MGFELTVIWTSLSACALGVDPAYFAQTDELCQTDLQIISNVTARDGTDHSRSSDATILLLFY